MTSTSDNRGNSQTRTYSRADSVVFLKTKELFGGLSNMAGGFPLCVNNVRIRSSEALYQACRFPHLPDLQLEIIAQQSPMTAKMKSKPHRRQSRPDWDDVRVGIMRWCLRVKLAQNWGAFSRLLLETGERPIVEESRKDSFWGAKAVGDSTLVGTNVLGRLLMELRQIVKSEDRGALLRVQPLGIRDFSLAGRPIEVVAASDVEMPAAVALPVDEHSQARSTQTSGVQGLLFDRPLIRGAPSVRAADSKVGLDLRSYPAMKDSGVESLGAVPSHWSITPIGRIGPLFKGSGGSKEDEVSNGVPCVRYGDLYTKHEFFIHKTKAFVTPERADSYTPIHYGDVLFAASGETIEDIGRSAVNLMRSDARCGGDVLVLRPTVKAVPQFLGYAADSIGARHQKACMGRGFTVVHIYATELKQLVLPLPPLEEQASIVRFLDHADRRIRRYISAKQKLIKLLEEQKQAIIHRAVTRGLDPNVRLKPSGVEWLGDVPEHWSILRGKVLFAEAHLPVADSDEIVTCFRDGQVTLRRNRRTTGFMIALKEAGYQGVRRGQLVIHAMDAFAGAVGVSDSDGKCTPEYIVCNPRLEGTVAAYYAHCLRIAARLGFVEVSCPAVRERAPRLRYPSFGQMMFPTPHPPEQAAIVRFTDRATAGLGVNIERARRKIDLLREFRIRLIADVVTGKRDVREASARLPEIQDEPEPLDRVDEVDDSIDDESDADAIALEHDNEVADE